MGAICSHLCLYGHSTAGFHVKADLLTPMAVFEDTRQREVERVVRRSRARARLRGGLWLVVVYSVLTFVAVLTILPYLWMVMNSFKEQSNFYQDPYSLIPTKWSIRTYYSVLTVGKVGRYVVNSLAYSSTVLAAQLLMNSLAAYAFARIEFKGRNVLFILFLATMMLPSSVTLIPTYVLVYSLKLANSFAGVVLPSFAGAFGVFLLRQFFLNIPRELEDAAVMDGAGRLRIYWQIILPLAKPAMITLGVFTVLGEWQSFIWPLVVLTERDKYPITVGLNLFKDSNRVYW